MACRVLKGKPEHISKYKTALNKFDLAFITNSFAPPMWHLSDKIA